MSGTPSPALPDFADLFEHAPCGYLATDTEGRIAAVNATFAAWTGHGGAHLVGRRFQDLLNVAGRVYYETHLTPLLRLQGAFTEIALDIVKADRTLLPVLVNAVERRGGGDASPFVWITVFDATERRRYELDLLAERRRAEAASDALAELNATLEQQVEARTAERNRLWRSSLDLLVSASPDGTIEAVNPRWTQLLGWEPGAIVGRSFVEFTHPDDLTATLAVFADIVEHPLANPYEYRFRHRDGSYRWFAWTAAFEGEKIYATGRDVTDQHAQRDALRVSEEALRQSQKMEAVGQLTGGVAHDFNNLLTVIKSSSDLLKRPDLPEERRARYVAAIADTVDRAAKLTGQLLAFARRQALKPEVFRVGDSVRGLADMMGTLTGSRVRITTHLPDEPCYVYADASQFDTALVNLAVNARDAMEGEGHIAIAVSPVEAVPPTRAHATVPGPYVAVSLTDTGSGISPDTVKRIFEPFFTTKEVGKGTGLGLSQVFGFAKQSGGDVTVDSTVGEGTTFTLYLPRVGAPAEARAEEQPEASTDGQGTRVLVVEDNVAVGTFAVQTLGDLGYTPVLAADGVAALAELARDADRFDVVFSDVVMPGMSGIELGAEISRLHPGLPVVLTSGYSHVLAETGTHGLELLHKPYSVEQLSQILRKAVVRRQRGRRTQAPADMN